MTNKNVKRISMILAALMVAGAATGCGAKKDTKVESTNKAAENSAKLDEDAIKDTYTGIDDMYVLEGSKDVDYLDGVLYDSSIVKGIDVDSSKVDASKTGDYKITFSITADRTAYDAFRDAFIKSETVKDKLSTDKAKTDKESADKTKTKTETVKVKKDTVVVNRDEAQKLADQDKLVRTDNGGTVKKSDGTEVKTEQKAPASTAVTGGNVVDASAKTEVKPETTAAPAMSPEEAKKEEAKKDDKKEETKKPSTSGGKDNSGSTSKPSSGSNKPNNGSGSNSKPSHKPDSGSNKPNNGSGSNSKPSSKPNSGSNKPNNGSSSNSKPSHKPDSGSSKPNNGNSSNSKPSHTHTWVNITKTVNHPAVTHQEDVYENRQVKVKDAWDEQVRVDAGAECRQCGYRTTNPDDMTMHCLEYGHTSHNITENKTVHHDAVYETKRVKTGTKTVVDRAAWTETVVIGQKCSSCGKRK